MISATGSSIHLKTVSSSYVMRIQDDILDLTSTAEQLGKPVLSDEKNHKTTYVTLNGLEKARADVARISEEAVTILQKLPGENPFLEDLVRMLVDRKS